VQIRYTTDGSSPTSAGHAVYDGPFRVPANARIVCAMAVAAAYDLSSEVLRIPIPQKGEEVRALDPQIPARWKQATKFDDAGAVWNFIEQLEKAVGATAYDIGLTAESVDGQQHVEFSGALEGGYGAAALKIVADKLQDTVGEGGLRMTVGSLGFATGQGLLDWLKINKQAFNQAKVSQ
jgi:hypothetical protein